jgi:hypothetical protein
MELVIHAKKRLSKGMLDIDGVDHDKKISGTSGTEFIIPVAFLYIQKTTVEKPHESAVEWEPQNNSQYIVQQEKITSQGKNTFNIWLSMAAAPATSNIQFHSVKE